MGYVSNPQQATASSNSVVVNDNVSVSHTGDTTETTLKTYTGLTFATGTAFRITVFGDVSGGTTTTWKLYVSDGTNETACVSIGNIAVDSFFTVTVCQQDSATTTAIRARNINCVNVTVQGNDGDGTLTGSINWADLDRFVLKTTNGTAGITATIDRVIIEELTVVA